MRSSAIALAMHSQSATSSKALSLPGTVRAGLHKRSSGSATNLSHWPEEKRRMELADQSRRAM